MDVKNLGDVLPVYYSRLFPFNHIYRWLSYGNGKTFSNREFSFILRDDVYIRYQSFNNAKELEQEVRRLVPFKIDIGAVYNDCPRRHNILSKFEPVEREFVLDIDMTDYDDIRICCAGADICRKCWKFMGIACKILDRALKDDFGFKDILWVFSGRRGIHAWICDQRARVLTGQARRGVAEYLSVISGGEYMRKKVTLPGDKIHHSLQRALNIIKPLFIKVCIEEQKMLETAEAIEKFLGILQKDEDRQELKALFNQCDSGIAKWEMFIKFATEKQTDSKQRYLYRHIVEEIMLQYSYPRLDIQVSKGMNHLLKAPFCVHPKTGKICIPFTANTIDKFDPGEVPTVLSLLNEIDDFGKKANNTSENENVNTSKIEDYKKTSLKKSLQIFKEFLWKLEKHNKPKMGVSTDELF